MNKNSLTCFTYRLHFLQAIPQVLSSAGGEWRTLRGLPWVGSRGNTTVYNWLVNPKDADIILHKKPYNLGLRYM